MNQRQTAPAPSLRGSALANVAVALVLLGAIAFFVLRGAAQDPTPAGLSVSEQYAADSRIALLTGGCSFGATFDVDLSDPLQVLAGKLDAGGQLEPKKRAIRELAEVGAPAAEVLGRLFRDASKDRMRVRVAHSVLSVCALSEDPFGVQLALEGLQSTREDIRGEACLVLSKHPAPEHFDAVLAVLPSFTLPSTGDYALRALVACDEVRFAEQLESWLRERPDPDQFLISRPVDSGTTLLAGSHLPEVAEIARRILESEDNLLPRHRIFLLAPLARAGDVEARQELQDLLAHELPKPRIFAAEALAKAGFADDAYVLASTSFEPQERSTVIRLVFEEQYEPLRTPEQQEEVQALARATLGDPQLEIQEVALRALLRWGDDEGRATLLARLAGTIPEREMATRCMRDHLDQDRSFRDQVRNNLIAAWNQERNGAVQEAVLESILVALGAVPGPETARFLLERADEISLMPARKGRGYRWVVGQVWNAGPEARGVILERLGSETDPFKRLDLISFAWQDFTDASYEVLVGIVEDETIASEERLYAADRVLHMARNRRFMPTLKRIYRGSTDSILRPGLQCLLWAWFGPPVL